MSIELLGKKRQIYIYDYEVFSQSISPQTGEPYWCVVFKNYHANEWKVIRNDITALREFYTQTKDDIFIGYNVRNYDQYIHKGLLLGMNPGVINDKLIYDNMKGYQVVPKAKSVPFYTYDIANGFNSLKQLEGFMGHDIQESSVPFDITRELTIDEEKEVIKYCMHDVGETSEVLANRWTEFTSHIGLMEMFQLDMSMISNTSAQMTALILDAKKRKYQHDEFDFIFPDTLKLEKYKYVLDYFEDIKHTCHDGDKPVELVTMIGKMETTYALGGVHGAIPNYISEGLIYSLDVASLYPALIIEYGLMSRAVLSVEKFKEIRDTRLSYKAVGNPLQAALKITINSVYGCFGDKYNALFDPKMMRSVCVHGMLLLTDLVEKIEPYCELLNYNTDGIFFQIEKEEDLQGILDIAKEWETRTRLELELEEYTRIIQKDVNNYIVVPNGPLYNDKGKPNYKGKGSYLKELSNLDYDLPIVNKAMKEYFIKDIPIEDTINNATDLREFQKIIKLTSAYAYTKKDVKYEKVKEVNPDTGRLRTVEQLVNEGEILKDKTYRVFASTDENDGGIFKQKIGKNPEKFANTPLKCFIDNDHVLDKTIPDKLDREYYIQVTQERIYQYEGLDKNGKPKKPSKSKVNDEKYVNAI